MTNPSHQNQPIQLGPVSITCFTLAATGWIIWIGNLFSNAFFIEGFIPRHSDLTSLILSSLLFAILGLTPSFFRALSKRS